MMAQPVDNRFSISPWPATVTFTTQLAPAAGQLKTTTVQNFDPIVILISLSNHHITYHNTSQRMRPNGRTIRACVEIP